MTFLIKILKHSDYDKQKSLCLCTQVLVRISLMSTKKKRNWLQFILEKRIMRQDKSSACTASTKLFSYKELNSIFKSN